MRHARHIGDLIMTIAVWAVIVVMFTVLVTAALICALFDDIRHLLAYYIKGTPIP